VVSGCGPLHLGKVTFIGEVSSVVRCGTYVSAGSRLVAMNGVWPPADDRGVNGASQFASLDANCVVAKPPVL